MSRLLSRASTAQPARRLRGLGLGAAWLAGAASGPSACAAPSEPTSVRVEFTSDLPVGSELTEVRVQIFDRARVNELATRSIALTTTPGLPVRYTLPASFALIPNARDVTEFRLVLTGRGPLGGGAVVDLVERQAIGTFVEHEQQRLSLALSRSCLGQLCRDAMDLRSELTCSSGACVSALQSTSRSPDSDAGARAASHAASTSADRLGPAVGFGLVEVALESADERP